MEVAKNDVDGLIEAVQAAFISFDPKYLKLLFLKRIELLGGNHFG